MKPQRKLATTLFLMVLFFGTHYAQTKNELGEGFFAPNSAQFETLYLYDIPNSRNGSREQPIDSITFVKRHSNHVDGIGYAPKDFAPYHEKLDYGVFIIKVKRLGNEFTEIIINENTGETVYVKSHTGNFMTWSEFLLSCHSVEFNDTNQKVFNHPKIKSAGRIVDPSYFRPRYIMGDWMEVQLLDSGYNKAVGKGWIRWKKDEKLLIKYNLFS